MAGRDVNNGKGAPKKLRKSAGWNLYWVYSGGLEDCFVVARNVRSAIKVEQTMNGFDVGDVSAVHVSRVPEDVARRKLNSYAKRNAAWPWYARDDLLGSIGAEFRDIEGRRETLIDDVVYRQGEFPRSIGRRFIKELRQDDAFSGFEEDEFTGRQNVLFGLLGVCIARCQQIEHYISHSFVLSVSAKDKSKFETIDDLTRSWKKKTLGQLVRAIEESYELEPTFKSALEWFLEMRNLLVHGLTTHAKYDIETEWGQDEMICFLARFELMSRAVRMAFRACYLLSIDYGLNFLIERPSRKMRLTKKQLEEVSIFPHFFTLKETK